MLIIPHSHKTAISLTDQEHVRVRPMLVKSYADTEVRNIVISIAHVTVCNDRAASPQTNPLSICRSSCGYCNSMLDCTSHRLRLHFGALSIASHDVPGRATGRLVKYRPAAGLAYIDSDSIVRLIFLVVAILAWGVLCFGSPGL